MRCRPAREKHRVWHGPCNDGTLSLRPAVFGLLSSTPPDALAWFREAASIPHGWSRTAGDPITSAHLEAAAAGLPAASKIAPPEETTMKRIFRVLGACALVAVSAGSAQAQGWPNRPIRMVVPYTPGGYTDLMARLVSQKLSEALGQPFVIENKPGANAVIGTDSVAKAAPDGYTFGTVIAAHAVNATLNAKLPYDTLKDFSYVSVTSVAPLILIAHPSVPANTMKELIALAKAKPGALNFASSGIGSAAHLTMEMLKSREGINLQHIPYKGFLGFHRLTRWCINHT
jgi:hypothetical protein